MNEGRPERIENIEIDQVQAIENFCQQRDAQSEREKLTSVRIFLRTVLRNAIAPGVRIPPEVESRIWDQETIKKLSQVFTDRYGVCVEWHVVGQVILKRIGIEAIFRTGVIPGAPGHTYLDVKIDGQWEIFDPFAEKYLEDIGHQGQKQFQEEYYRDSLTRKPTAQS